MTKLFLASFLMVITSCGQAQTSTFKSPKYNYTINKPSGFEQTTATGVHIDYKVVNKTDGSSILVNVSNRQPEERGIDAWNYSKEYFEKVFSYQDPVFVISKAEKITIDGKKTFLLYYSYPSNGGTKLKVIEAYLFVGKNAYVITATSDEQHYGEYKTVFLGTIKSMKF
ncbi:MAG: hypothetical protein QM727_07220 [Niabella sp.]